MRYDNPDYGAAFGDESPSTLALLDENEQEELEEWAFFWSIMQQMMEAENARE